MAHHRLPKTHNEQIANCRCDDDNHVKIRGRRNNLPDSWSDINPTKQRNWKKHRKNRWK